MTVPILQAFIQQHLALLLTGSALILVLPAILITRLRGEARARREREAFQAQIEELRRENRSLGEFTARVARRLKQAEEQVAQLSTRIETARTQELATDSDHAYAQAIRLVRRGADADRLVMDFGLARGEAELVAHMHGQRKTG
jgi:hypothetical protein